MRARGAPGVVTGGRGRVDGDEWRAQVLPTDEHDVVRDLEADGHTMAMIGDGINDARAPALADVGAGSRPADSRRAAS